MIRSRELWDELNCTYVRNPRLIVDFSVVIALRHKLVDFWEIESPDHF
jgi:hypothetical protein